MTRHWPLHGAAYLLEENSMWHRFSLKTATFALILSLTASSALVGQDKADPAKEDLAALQATWTVVATEKGVLQPPRKKNKGDEPQSITFSGDKFELRLGGAVAQAGTLKLDPAKNPKAIDANVTEGEGKGMVKLGIYELDGNTL